MKTKNGSININDDKYFGHPDKWLLKRVYLGNIKYMVWPPVSRTGGSMMFERYDQAIAHLRQKLNENDPHYKQ